MDRPLNVRLLVACFGLIAFLALSLYGGIFQRWWLFAGALALAAGSAAYAIVVGEWWRTTRGDDSVRPFRRR
ncbi:hypothetical protein Sru01_50070 [Sphaerisporangium rufum]|uniref:Uncharacterized protein n=1 Tax=Sphaerisporangium rufum TaxID=1381558 RepID=A0A919V760_9ACTN|nr:hypothetical protein [Sphaerisporangium rufum]GII80025.1 hypothetical protein Sru01_50070 [Sphaerisporangium rufum]